jgi:hypothetical protein
MGSAQVHQGQQLVQSHPERRWYRPSRRLCSLWKRRAPNGQLKEIAALTLLLKLATDLPEPECGDGI